MYLCMSGRSLLSKTAGILEELVLNCGKACLNHPEEEKGIDDETDGPGKEVYLT